MPSGDASSTTIKSASGSGRAHGGDEARQIFAFVVSRRDDERLQSTGAQYASITDRTGRVVTKSEPATTEVRSETMRSSCATSPSSRKRSAHQTRISSALREIGQALGTTLDLDQLLELILEKITEAVDADRATLYLLDDARGELVSRIVARARRAIDPAQGRRRHRRTRREDGPRRHRARRRTRTRASLRSGTCSRATGRASILAAPMKNHLGKTIGVVQVLNKKHGDFTDDDAVLLARARHAGGGQRSTTRASFSRR